MKSSSSGGCGHGPTSSRWLEHSFSLCSFPSRWVLDQVCCVAFLLTSDRTRCERCLLPDPRCTEVHSDSHQDHRSAAQLGRVGADRRRRISAGGDSGRAGRAHSGVAVFREHWSAQGETTPGESQLMLRAGCASMLISARAVWRAEVSPV